MKDSYEKDPFAEYDKYWDELDKQEEEVKRKQNLNYNEHEKNRRPRKSYNFEDYDQKPKENFDVNKAKLGIVAAIFVFGFIFLIIFQFGVFDVGFTISPFFIFIFIMIILSSFSKKKR